MRATAVWDAAGYAVFADVLREDACSTLQEALQVLTPEGAGTRCLPERREYAPRAARLRRDPRIVACLPACRLHRRAMHVFRKIGDLQLAGADAPGPVGSRAGATGRIDLAGLVAERRSLASAAARRPVGAVGGVARAYRRPRSCRWPTTAHPGDASSRGRRRRAQCRVAPPARRSDLRDATWLSAGLAAAAVACLFEVHRVQSQPASGFAFSVRTARITRGPAVATECRRPMSGLGDCRRRRFDFRKPIDGFEQIRQAVGPGHVAHGRCRER